MQDKVSGGVSGHSRDSLNAVKLYFQDLWVYLFFFFFYFTAFVVSTLIVKQLYLATDGTIPNLKSSL